jgi:multidrug efflux pump subunit AcrB
VARLDGVPFHALGVLKQRGTNAVSVATGVREWES